MRVPKDQQASLWMLFPKLAQLCSSLIITRDILLRVVEGAMRHHDA
jgi:hypothetical protein